MEWWSTIVITGYLNLPRTVMRLNTYLKKMPKKTNDKAREKMEAAFWAESKRKRYASVVVSNIKTLLKSEERTSAKALLQDMLIHAITYRRSL